jgi:hypothetical protein
MAFEYVIMAFAFVITAFAGGQRHDHGAKPAASAMITKRWPG